MTMDEKMKELIAVGASVGAHCQPCLTYHAGKAKEMGIEQNDKQKQEAGACGPGCNCGTTGSGGRWEACF